MCSRTQWPLLQSHHACVNNHCGIGRGFRCNSVMLFVKARPWQGTRIVYSKLSKSRIKLCSIKKCVCTCMNTCLMWVLFQVYGVVVALNIPYKFLRIESKGSDSGRLTCLNIYLGVNQSMDCVIIGSLDPLIHDPIWVPFSNGFMPGSSTPVSSTTVSSSPVLSTPILSTVVSST